MASSRLEDILKTLSSEYRSMYLAQYKIENGEEMKLVKPIINPYEKPISFIPFCSFWEKEDYIQFCEVEESKSIFVSLSEAEEKQKTQKLPTISSDVIEIKKKSKNDSSNAFFKSNPNLSSESKVVVKYSKEKRDEKIVRYKEKRAKHLAKIASLPKGIVANQYRFQFRKILAGGRARVKGRFVKMTEEEKRMLRKKRGLINKGF